LAGKASLRELDQVYDVDDVIKANTVLDIEEAIKEVLEKKL